MILAAGQGTRMKSALPKVLHPSCGRPIVHYPVRAALDAGAHDVVVVVGHGRAHVSEYLGAAFGEQVRTAVQEQQRGTGDAAIAGMNAIAHDTDRVIIYYGDVPLLEAEDIAGLLHAFDAQVDADVRPLAIAMAICSLENPFGYGRVLRNAAGDISEIREQKDLKTASEHATKEINPGIYVASASFLREALASLTPNNAQKEYYLTDIVAFAASRDQRVVGVLARPEVMEGVNDREQLFRAEKAMNERLVTRLRKSGVTIREGVRVEDSVVVEADAILETGVVLRGKTHIGATAVIDVGCVLTDVVVAGGARLLPYTVAQRAQVGARAQVGPFSHLRPETELAEDTHIGNFVETKKTKVGKGSKANHLAYLGDGIIGENVNVGAGTIFCNYDGANKNTTTLEDGCFIGSDSHLVAPVRVGKGAYVATGTTVTMDVPDNALAISRPKQENKEGYATRLRARIDAAKAAKIAAKTSE